eukprot:3580961-Pleurochrysis_carterae.AAC.1
MLHTHARTHVKWLTGAVACAAALASHGCTHTLPLSHSRSQTLARSLSRVLRQELAHTHTTSRRFENNPPSRKIRQLRISMRRKPAKEGEAKAASTTTCLCEHDDLLALLLERLADHRKEQA